MTVIQAQAEIDHQAADAMRQEQFLQRGDEFTAVVGQGAVGNEDNRADRPAIVRMCPGWH